MELIDKERVEEILRNLWKEDDGTNPAHRICYDKALQEVQYELDKLEVKEVDLDEELTNFIMSYRNRETGYSLDTLAKHFYELGLKAQKG